MRCLPALLLLLPLLAMSAMAVAEEHEVVPLVAAHAHNDYEHRRPLVDALGHGFMSVEADVHVVDGALLVAHDRDEVAPGRTLEALYLEPLAARVAGNGGRVYAGGKEPLWLLVDIKGDAAETWRVLAPLLERHAGMLTEFSNGRVTPRAVTVVLSGNRPVGTLAGMERRLAFIDGRPEDLEGSPPVSAMLVPLVSADARKVFRWKGGPEGPREEDVRVLRGMAEKAHAQGRRLRYWGTRDSREVWDFLKGGGVDLIGTDDLAALRRFLEGR